MNPAPIAGVVIAIMGVSLMLVGLAPLFSAKGITYLTLIMGIVFTAIGVAMIATRWLGRLQRRVCH